MDRGYVLHTYPYRETSLILQVWTEKHGRLGLVAKGARRPKSASRAVLVPFQPLTLDWFGRGGLRKSTARADPREGLLAASDDASSGLRLIWRQARQDRVEPVLRRFELR